MKFKNPMLVVTDIDKSVEFYRQVKHTKSLSVQVIFLLVVTILKSILKKMILINLLIG